MKVVINKCFGGFGLSDKALKRYCELSGKDVTYDREIGRNDPHLVQVVEEMGSDSFGSCAKLEVVEIPGDLGMDEVYISDYDGVESIHENHRSW